MKLLHSIVVLLALTVPSAQAATVASVYTPLGADQWSVSFTVGNDGDPSPIGAFTIYFAESAFAGLDLLSHPATWDSVVIQPDLAIPAAGYLDAVAFDPAAALAEGQSQGEFQIRFTLRGSARDFVLPFDVVAQNFEIVSSGFTRVTVTPPSGGPLPEPAPYALLALAALGLLHSRARSLP